MIGTDRYRWWELAAIGRGVCSMLVDPGGSAAVSTVAGAIRQASQATGTSFSYLLATAQVESGLNPGAGASTSSARGLFQFVDQTWLGTMKQSGAALGYGRYAAAITRTASGHYEVKDPTLRSQILKLRSDPTANATMAGAFTRANATYLAQKLGRTPTEGELYIAHFLGAGGAARLISLATSNPNAKSTNFFANAAHANRGIFYDRRTGGARTVAQVRDALTDRYNVARSRPVVPAGQALAANDTVPAAPMAQAQAASYSPPLVSAPLSIASASPPLSAVPDTAGITSAFAAAAPMHHQTDYPMFRALFSNNASNKSPVGQLWSVPDSQAPAAVASPSAPVAFNLLDLFKDPVAGS
jgi:hypothetical protein